MGLLGSVHSSVEGVMMSRRVFTLFFLAYFSSTNWYALATDLVPKVFQTPLVEGFNWTGFGFDFMMASSMLAASLILKKQDRLLILRFCAFATIFLTLMLSLTSTSEMAIILLSSLGIPAGVASLALVTWFSEITVPIERGRVAGAVIAFSLLFGSFIVVFSRSLGATGSLGALLALNSTIIVLSFLKHEKPHADKPESSVPRFGKNYILYLAAWAFISMYNGFLSPLFGIYMKSVQGSGFVLEYMAGCVFALLGGFLMDWYGRKPLLLLGIAFLGVSTSLIAFASNSYTFNLVYMASGVSWALFLPTFYLFIWVEASKSSRVFALALGLAIFHFMRSIGSVVYPLLSQMQPIGLASISSIIIFLSMVPLVLANETLSQEERESLRFSSYIHKVRREVERGQRA